MEILVAIGVGIFGWWGIEFQVYSLTFNVVLITLWHYSASVSFVRLTKLVKIHI